MRKISGNGGTALITSLLILALMVFAILTLTGYQADQRLYENMKASTIGFYSAECKANQWLADLRADGVSGEYESQFDAGEGQALACTVRISDFGQYEVLHWALVRTEPWTGDFTLPVYQGD